MNSGVYCRPKSTTTVHNSIIIDCFNKIFGDPPTESPQTITANMDSLGPSSDCTNSSEEEKWDCGMNVRARYADDGEYYEATIEKIFDEYAIVRFLGYDNEDAVKLQDLRPSLGEESITEQIKKATDEQNYAGSEMDDECDDEDEIEWKVGMSCRAFYEPNEVVYEAVIQEVSQKDRKAVVIMSGYGIPYEVSFEDMYESIPELRIKQERSAKNVLAQKAKSQDNEPKSSDIPNPLKSTAVGDIKINDNDNEAFTPFNGAKIYPPPDLTNVNPINGPTCGFSNCQGMLQPQGENDALACLVSSTYLSGYYAGYYDCMKKLHNTNR